jgi:hypothetical protein
MRLALRWFGQEQWEATSQNVATKAKSATSNWLERAAQRFVQRLMTDAEPQVWQTTDANGKRWWNAHDPATGRSLYNVPEAEMRAWLEQRYYPVKANAIRGSMGVTDLWHSER